MVRYNNELSFGVFDSEKNNHKLIIGENYDALKNLLVTYTKNGKGLVDVIYIDPPYNTEKTREEGNDYKEEVESNKFIYRDKFKRSGWLNMMKERLLLARKLLSETGVIFISIDDNEQAYLKILCDEIFGEENFVASFVINSAPAGTQSSTDISIQHSYSLLYKKSNILIKNIIRTEEELKKKYNKIDENGRFYTERIWKRGVGGKKEDVPSLHFPIYYDEKEDKIFLEDEVDNKKDFIKIIPYQTIGVLGRWTWSKKLMKEKRNKLIVLKVNGEYKLYKKVYEYEDDGIKPCSIINEEELLFNTIVNSDIGRTELGSIKLKNILGGKLFEYPKPVELIKYLLQITTNKDSIILDFFAGSGTTGQAVMELNEEDNGNRQCILVTNNENDIAYNVCRERLYRVVNGKGSNNEPIEWEYSKEIPSLLNNKWDVFEIENNELKIDDFEKAKELLEQSKNEFKRLNKDYEHKDFDIYNQLSSLRPFKEEEKK